MFIKMFLCQLFSISPLNTHLPATAPSAVVFFNLL
uniref:Uncharacterized protein n=1 Tax=Anguilla anguilla TaxID=7936 RepID=A0A0E9VZT8_ANGAN